MLTSRAMNKLTRFGWNFYETIYLGGSLLARLCILRSRGQAANAVKSLKFSVSCSSAAPCLVARWLGESHCSTPLEVSIMHKSRVSESMKVMKLFLQPECAPVRSAHQKCSEQKGGIRQLRLPDRGRALILQGPIAEN